MKKMFIIGMVLFIIGGAGIIFTILKSEEAKAPVSKELEALMQIDRNFDKDVAEKGVDAWVSYFAEEGKMFRAGGVITEGKTAIRELMAPVFVTPGFSLRWEPIGGDIAKSGEIGYTYGSAISKTIDKDRKEQVRTGKYVTIWKKQSDGSWKAVLDIGTSYAPPPESSSKKK